MQNPFLFMLAKSSDFTKSSCSASDACYAASATCAVVSAPVEAAAGFAGTILRFLTLLWSSWIL
jgi:hypothetical protein